MSALYVGAGPERERPVVDRDDRLADYDERARAAGGTDLAAVWADGRCRFTGAG
jgi:hypothetical protein